MGVFKRAVDKAAAKLDQQINEKVTAESSWCASCRKHYDPRKEGHNH